MNRAQMLSTRRKTRKKFQIPKRVVLQSIKLVIIVLSIAFPFYLFPRLIPIANVRCESQYGACSQVVAEKLGTLSPSNYIDTKQNLLRLIETQVFVKDFAVRFVFPSTLTVFVVERIPIMSLAREGELGEFAYVDADGFIIAVRQTSDLPILIIDKSSQFAPGQKIPDDLQFAVTISDQSFKKYNSRLSILKSDSIEVDLPIGATVIFPRSGEADVLFGSLTLILSRLNTLDSASRIDSNDLPKVIDLRYKNPVVKNNI